jgi:hypothetical protein
VSCCQLLAKLLDSPQQPASFPLPVQSSTACHGRPVCLSLALSALVRICLRVLLSELFLVCEKAAFTVPYVVPYVVPMRALLLWKFNVSLNFFGFQSIFAFHRIFKKNSLKVFHSFLHFIDF